MKKLLLIPALLLMLAGCASTDVNRTFQAGYGITKVVRLTAADLTDADKISVKTAEEVLEYSDQAEQQLDAAWTAKDAATDESLSEVRRVTTALKLYLSNLIKGTENE